MQVSNLIRKYEKSKAERAEEEQQEELEKLECERVRRDLERKQKQEQKDIYQGLKRARKLQEEQWTLVCAAAGVEPSSTAKTVVGMFDAYTKMQGELESKLRELRDSNKNSETKKSSNDMNEIEPLTVEEEEEEEEEGSQLDQTLDPRSNAHHAHNISEVRIQMSLKHLQNKLKAFFAVERSETSNNIAQGNDISAQLETHTSLRRRSSMLSLRPRRMSAAQLQQKLDKKEQKDAWSLQPTSTESAGFFDTSSCINKEELCRLFERLARMETSSCVNNDSRSYCESHDIVVSFTKDTHVGESMANDASALMGQRDCMPVKRIGNSQEITENQPKSILGRRDIKSRSYRMKARIDRQKHQMLA